MNADEFREGVEHLDRLAQGDYHVSLGTLLKAGDPGTRLVRLGRLMGVAMKEPLAFPVDRDSPSGYSGSYRDWLVPDDLSEHNVPPAFPGSWQHQTLATLASGRATVDVQMADVVQLVYELKYERGFFSYLAESIRKYLCGDAELRKKIEDQIGAGKEAGVGAQLAKPELLVQAGGAYTRFVAHSKCARARHRGCTGHRWFDFDSLQHRS